MEKQPLSVGVVVELGNSGTRFTVEVESRTYRGELSNEFALIPQGYSIPARYLAKGTDLFIYKGNYYANGVLVHREFKGKEIRPTKGDKVGQLVTELTLNLILLRVYDILTNSSGRQANDFAITFHFTVLLPPLEQDVNSVAMAALLKTFTNVKRSHPTSVDFEFAVADDVNVESEAVAAYFGATFRDVEAKLVHGNPELLSKGEILTYTASKTLQPKIIPENKDALRGRCLLIDVGGGTSDIAVIEDGEVIENSKDTFNYGGRYVAGQLTNLIRKKMRFTPPDIEQLVATGVLEEGSFRHNASDELIMAKVDFATILGGEIRTYLERMNMELRTFSHILVVGGGSMPSKSWVLRTQVGEEVKETFYLPTDDNIPQGAELVQTSPPMTKILEDTLKEQAPYIRSMFVPDGAQRELNILGAGIIHRSIHYGE